MNLLEHTILTENLSHDTRKRETFLKTQCTSIPIYLKLLCISQKNIYIYRSNINERTKVCNSS